MPILNYTTTIAAEKTVMEIQQMLVKHGAQAVLTEYDEERILSHISFRLMTTHGPVYFRLPANVQGVFKALQKDRNVSRAKKTRQQAARVAWRICKDWVEAQLAIVHAEMADMLEVFLPYAQTETGETLYERIRDRGFPLLTNQKGERPSP